MEAYQSFETTHPPISNTCTTATSDTRSLPASDTCNLAASNTHIPATSNTYIPATAKTHIPPTSNTCTPATTPICNPLPTTTLSVPPVDLSAMCLSPNKIRNGELVRFSTLTLSPGKVRKWNWGREGDNGQNSKGPGGGIKRRLARTTHTDSDCVSRHLSLTPNPARLFRWRCDDSTTDPTLFESARMKLQAAGSKSSLQLRTSYNRSSTQRTSFKFEDTTSESASNTGSTTQDKIRSRVSSRLSSNSNGIQVNNQNQDRGDGPCVSRRGIVYPGSAVGAFGGVDSVSDFYCLSPPPSSLSPFDILTSTSSTLLTSTTSSPQDILTSTSPVQEETSTSHSPVYMERKSIIS